MMGRLRDGLLNLLDEIGFRLRSLAPRRKRPARPVIKGNMENVLIVRPQSGIIREAVFILRDEGTAGVSRQELLRQAREAAREYIGEELPRRRGEVLLWAMPAACLAAVVLAALLL